MDRIIHKKNFGIVIILFLIVTFTFLFLQSSENTSLSHAIVRLDDRDIPLEIADTDTLRQKGLSNREHMEQNSGMLFIFDKPGPQYIWMKDMNFSLDIVWLDEDFNIVHVENDIKPETFPDVFQSVIPALYVLEFPAGFVETYHLNIGNKLTILSGNL